MRPVARTLLTMVAVGVLIQTGLRARNAYNQAIARGSRPIEGVGTAVAAFVGIAGPLGPVSGS
jgi:hypothetical protein